MAVLDLLWKQKPQSVPNQKASATGRVMAYHSAGRIAWSARDTVSLTKTGFCGNPVGYRVVKLIGEAAAAVPLMLTDGETRFSSHPILARLSDPNPAQTQGDFLEALYGQLMLLGNAYIEAVGRIRMNCISYALIACHWFLGAMGGPWPMNIRSMGANTDLI